LVEGGTFTMGATQEDVTYEWNSVPRRITVNSFYMDETEVSNIDYREYVYWTKRVFGDNYPQVWRNSLPDTMCWREELAYNEPYVETYFRFLLMTSIRWSAYRGYRLMNIVNGGLIGSMR
jgi:formylglycine-generating enzyme required for sulfatase activity